VYGMAAEDEHAGTQYAWWESPKLMGFGVLAGAAILTLALW